MSKSKLWPILKNYNFWQKIFLDLKFSEIVPSNIIYHFWEFHKYLGSKNLPKKFPDLKFSGIVPSNIIYHFWEFQKYLGSKRFFSKILSVEKSTNQFFYKHSRFFFEKRALSGVIIYQYLTSDQKLAKSSDGKYHNSWMLPSRNLQTTFLPI